MMPSDGRCVAHTGFKKYQISHKIPTFCFSYNWHVLALQAEPGSGCPLPGPLQSLLSLVSPPPPSLLTPEFPSRHPSFRHPSLC